jgi:hypothetical protein
MVMNYIPQDATWHKKQKYIWFRGGDLSDFEIIGHFLFEGGRDYHVLSWHEKQEYVWFRGENLNSFKKNLATSCLRGNRTTLYDHDLHTIWCFLTQGTRIYRVEGWRIQQLSRYKKCPLLCPHPTPGTMTLTWKLFE